MQRFSLFHGVDERILKAWHTPYAQIFIGCEPVLDVGCGLGYFADLLRDRNVKCIGLDIDPAMVAAANSRGHVAHSGDQRSIDKLGMKFGGIHVSHVIEHLWGEDVIELMENCAANLQDSGRLVIRTPNWEVAEVRHKVFWLDHTHRRPYGLELIIRILSDIGLRIVAAGYEPYNLHDLYVVAEKGTSEKLKVQLDFSHNPFPRISHKRKLFQRTPLWLKAMIRPFRKNYK